MLHTYIYNIFQLYLEPFFQNRQDVISNINLFDFIAGISLFMCLYTVGNAIKKQFKFESVSIGIIFYLFSFFIFDCFVLFFYQKLTFLEILYLVNLLWLSFFIVKLKNLKNIIYLLVPFTFLRLYFEQYKHKLTFNNNIRGDVEAVFFEQAKNIYEGSYFISINNYVFEGYPQFLSYIQSIFLGPLEVFLVITFLPSLPI